MFHILRFYEAEPNKIMKYISTSETQTKKFAQDLIKNFSQQKREGALVFALSGQLGAGKTRFVQGAAKFLGIERNITSPTFVLMKRYNLEGEFKSFYHFDCYRLQSSKELSDLGWKKIVFNPKNIVFVEWAEKVKDILPPNAIHVFMKDEGENRREIIIGKGI